MKTGLIIGILLVAFGLTSNAQTKTKTTTDLENGNTIKKVDVEHKGRKGRKAIVYNEDGEIIKKGKGKKGRNGAKKGKKIKYNSDGSVIGMQKGRAVKTKGDKKIKKHHAKRS